MTLDQIRELLENPGTRDQGAIAFGDWIRAECLFFGTTLETASYCGTFAAIGMKAEFDGKPRTFRGLYG